MKSCTYIALSGLSGLHKTYKPDARELGVGFVGFPYREPDTLRPRRNRHSQNAVEGMK